MEDKTQETKGCESECCVGGKAQVNGQCAEEQMQTSDQCLSSKAQARKQALAARNALPEVSRAEKSARISHKLVRYFEDGFAAIKTSTTCVSSLSNATNVSSSVPLIALYAAIKSEVNLNIFIDLARKRDWQLCFPAMIKNEACEKNSSDENREASTRNNTGSTCTKDSSVSKSHMEFFLVSPGESAPFVSDPLQSFTPGELEQLGFLHVNPTAIDAVVVPLVAFDKTNARLGYGGGNYDRFLAHLSKHALVAGAAFEEQCLTCVPIEAHDLPLPFIAYA